MDLERAAARAPSISVLWAAARREQVLGLATKAASRHVRTYLLGPADLGATLPERRQLKDHSARLLARRGIAAAADLALWGRGQGGALIVPGEDCPRWLPLSPLQARAAFQWFTHLFWRHAPEEGWADLAGYRFRRCADSLFEAAPPPPDAPVQLSPAAPWASASAEAGDDVLITATAIEVRAAMAGAWSLRLLLDPLAGPALSR